MSSFLKVLLEVQTVHGAPGASSFFRPYILYTPMSKVGAFLSKVVTI